MTIFHAENHTYYNSTLLLGNSTVYLAIVRKRLHQGSNTQACVLNANLAFLIQLIIVVPLSVFNLVVQNWILGPFLCYLLPMLQVCKSELATKGGNFSFLISKNL